MNSDDPICISRQGLELGHLSVGEARELLQIGFLLPTDECWTHASAERRRLCELNALPAGARPGWLEQAKTSMVATTSAVMDRAGKITGQVTESIRRRQSVIGTATTKVLEDYAPRIARAGCRANEDDGSDHKRGAGRRRVPAEAIWRGLRLLAETGLSFCVGAGLYHLLPETSPQTPALIIRHSDLGTPSYAIEDEKETGTKAMIRTFTRLF